MNTKLGRKQVGMQQQVISIAPDGVVSGLEHKKGFDLKALGAASIKRASEMVWNEDHQSWEVHFLNGNHKLLGSKKLTTALYYEAGVDELGLDCTMRVGIVLFKNYEEAAQAEVRVLDHFRKRGEFVA